MKFINIMELNNLLDKIQLKNRIDHLKIRKNK